jgi:hypothetical protein
MLLIPLGKPALSASASCLSRLLLSRPLLPDRLVLCRLRLSPLLLCLSPNLSLDRCPLLLLPRGLCLSGPRRGSLLL